MHCVHIQILTQTTYVAYITIYVYRIPWVNILEYTVFTFGPQRGPLVTQQISVRQLHLIQLQPFF